MDVGALEHARRAGGGLVGGDELLEPGVVLRQRVAVVEVVFDHRVLRDVDPLVPILRAGGALRVAGASRPRVEQEGVGADLPGAVVGEHLGVAFVDDAPVQLLDPVLDLAGQLVVAREAGVVLALLVPSLILRRGHHAVAVGLGDVALLGVEQLRLCGLDPAQPVQILLAVGVQPRQLGHVVVEEVGQGQGTRLHLCRDHVALDAVGGGLKAGLRVQRLGRARREAARIGPKGSEVVAVADLPRLPLRFDAGQPKVSLVRLALRCDVEDARVNTAAAEQVKRKTTKSSPTRHRLPTSP